MIRHLRWKVVATNMLLISLVLLAVFAAVYFISRGNYHKNVQQQLYQALEQGDYGRSQPGMDSIPCCGRGLWQRHRPRGRQQLL